MELDKLYQGLERLKKDGEIVNSYGDSDPNTIAKVAEYLKDNGYEVIAEKYIFGITDYDRSLPYKKSEIQIQLEYWIDWNTELVWEFYVDILEKHKEEWNR